MFSNDIKYYCYISNTGLIKTQGDRVCEMFQWITFNFNKSSCSYIIIHVYIVQRSVYKGIHFHLIVGLPYYLILLHWVYTSFKIIQRYLKSYNKHTILSCQYVCLCIFQSVHNVNNFRNKELSFNTWISPNCKTFHY